VLRSQIDSKNTDERERERERERGGQEQRQGDRVVAMHLEFLAGTMEF
jgi:hypothetical protein